MNCPHCNEELEFDHDFYDSEVELSMEHAEGRVAFTLICAACNESLGEHNFELEQDISDFANEHENEESHELSIELSNEAFTDTLHNNVEYLGAEATISVDCMCGAHTEYLWSTQESASEIMKELE